MNDLKLEFATDEDFEDVYKSYMTHKYGKDDPDTLYLRLIGAGHSLGFFNSIERICWVRLELTVYILDVISHELIHMIMCDMGEHEASLALNKIWKPQYLGHARTLIDPHWLLFSRNDK